MEYARDQKLNEKLQLRRSLDPPPGCAEEGMREQMFIRNGIATSNPT
jgi:hypothetical protein